MPTQITADGKQYGEGYCTPKCMDTQQNFSFCPQRVIPIVFLPGIMGSNLLVKQNAEDRQKKRKIAWRPDDKVEASLYSSKLPEDRQLQLNPETTEVDIYDPKADPEGNLKIVATAETPLMMGDKFIIANKRAERKARERGWGEVYFTSYGDLLNGLETRLNLAFVDGKLNPLWNEVIGIDPKRCGADEKCQFKALTEKELRAVMTNCFYPVHALGFNWLKSAGTEATEIAKRIDALMKDYLKKGFQCEKVIIVTHSMGGLVARALCHPAYAKLNDEPAGSEKTFGSEKVLGMVYGAMPAIGAASGYRRMRAGFEGGDIADFIIGNRGDLVTPVLSNSVGGLQLLPSGAYGNGWLRIVNKSGVLKSLPANGDPYGEIYEKSNFWWGLLREPWINPADDPKAGLGHTKELLAKAKEFHQNIAETYHGNSYALYACDPRQPTFKHVTWQVPDSMTAENLDSLHIVSDLTQGLLKLTAQADVPEIPRLSMPSRSTPAQYQAYEAAARASIVKPADPGDGTVPEHSSDAQARSHKVKGIFRQAGYEHQGCYRSASATAATLYSIIRIAQDMKWTCT